MNLKFAQRVVKLLAVACCPFIASVATNRSAMGDQVVLEDNFNRQENDPNLEQVGGGWQTNSEKRAHGNKQVFLIDGAVKIERHASADHSVSFYHEASFSDAVITCRFKLPTGKDDFGLNLADMNEKSVHAGHICMVQIRPKQVSIRDLKTGVMNKAIHRAKKQKKLTDEQKQTIRQKGQSFDANVSLNQWHQLKVVVSGNTMSVVIDGKPTGQFSSPGIGHPTKSRLRVAVGKTAWLDDLKIVAGPAAR